MKVKKYFEDVSETLKNTLVSDIAGATIELEKAFDLLIDKSKKIRDKQGVFYFVGNGASATMSEHMSHDWFQNADVLTYTVSETAHITAIANDLSYEDVFSYRLGKAASDKDMLIAISSSGNSPNVVKAIKTAKEKGLYVVTVTGMSKNNKANKLGDMNFYVSLDTYGMIEAAHAVLLHCWLDLFLEKYMGGRH